MSLYETALAEEDLINQGNEDLVIIWDWIRLQIDFKKFRERAVIARNDPTAPVKVILMEYSSIWRNGDVLTYFFVPNTNINTTCLQSDLRVVDYLNKQISNRDPTISVYTRPKIVYEMPHAYRRQLVVKFNCHVDPPSPIEPLDEEV